MKPRLLKKFTIMLCRLFFYSALILLFIGCDVKPDTCKDQSSWSMKIGFYAANMTKNKVTVKDSLLSKLAYSRGSFSVSYPTKISKVAVTPLQNTDSLALSLTINDQNSTTLYIIYKRDRIFENYKCGFRTNFILDKVYTDPPIFDSIKIVQPYITDVYQENCKFYLSNDTIK